MKIVISFLRHLRDLWFYLKGTKDYGLWYKLGGNMDLKVFTNANWARNIDDIKSTSGGAFFLSKRLVS